MLEIVIISPKEQLEVVRQSILDLETSIEPNMNNTLSNQLKQFNQILFNMEKELEKQNF